MEGPRHLKRTRQDVVYDTIIFIILTFILLIVAYPLYFVIISSFSDPVPNRPEITGVPHHNRKQRNTTVPERELPHGRGN